MMDISDGVSQDIGHILDASQVGASLELWSLPIHRDAKPKDDPLQAALSDGEDFELLFTLSEEDYIKAKQHLDIFRIGKIIPEAGVCMGALSASTPPFPIARKGFTH